MSLKELAPMLLAVGNTDLTFCKFWFHLLGLSLKVAVPLYIIIIVLLSYDSNSVDEHLALGKGRI